MPTMIPCTYPAHRVKNHVAGTMAAASCSVETKRAVKMGTLTPTMKTSKSGAVPDGTRFEDNRSELGKGLYRGELTIRNGDNDALGSIEYELCEWDGVSAIEIKRLTVEEAYRGKGNAAHLMSELERLNPGVPINHGGLTPGGLKFNASYYGVQLSNELTLIDPDDDDADDYEYAGIVDGDELYRGGWTLDGERIPSPN